ncbi:MAG: J domain-containing protein [Sandaracinus sp.]
MPLDSKTLEKWTDAQLEAELQKRRLARARGVGSAPGAPSVVTPAPGGRVERALASIEREKEIAQAYANLELPKGAPIEDVEKKYKELSAKYAPEKQSDPSRVELAKELRDRLTRAYERLSTYLRSR